MGCLPIYRSLGVLLMKIAIATKEDLTTENERTDDWILKLALEQKGIEVDIIDWRDRSVDLTQYDAILVNSTWNVPRYPDEFLEWIERCDHGKKRLINSADILRLGLNKDQYLTFLLSRFGNADSPNGSITPSFFIKPGEGHPTFTEQLNALKAENPAVWSNDIVLKPIISADGVNTYRVTEDKELVEKKPNQYISFSAADKVMSDLLKKEGGRGVIIQPFIPNVEKKGEYQLVFIGNQFSHATVKPPGFKSSPNYKSRKAITTDELPPGMLEFAHNIWSFYNEHYPDSIVRGRIDCFVGDKGPILCEIETVEPQTNIRCLSANEQQVVLERYATAVADRAVQLNASANFSEERRSAVETLKIYLGEEESPKYLAMTKNLNVCTVINKIYDTHNNILKHLATAESKLELAKQHAPVYLKSCFTALNEYSKIDKPSIQDIDHLIKLLDDAKDAYSSGVLSHDRTRFSGAVRLMLKSVVSFASKLFLGAAHLFNIKTTTGSASFFSSTTSDKMIQDTHGDIENDMRSRIK